MHLIHNKKGKKNIAAIIQARMGSTRFPGKVMKTILGKKILKYQIERVSRSKLLNQIIIATTNKSRDDKIKDFCEENSLLYFRGNEDNVLNRYFECAKKFKTDIIVRLTSDCPLIDPKIIDLVLKKYLINNYDFVANTSPPIDSFYPDGMDVEVFSYKLLKMANYEANNDSEKEHVTEFFWKKPNIFNLYKCNLKKNLSHYRLTLDYPQDLKLLTEVIKALYIKKPKFNLSDIIKFLDENPKIRSLNSNI